MLIIQIGLKMMKKLLHAAPLLIDLRWVLLTLIELSMKARMVSSILIRYFMENKCYIMKNLWIKIMHMMRKHKHFMMIILQVNIFGLIDGQMYIQMQIYLPIVLFGRMFHKEIWETVTFWLPLLHLLNFQIF